ncbi:hypothetical protein ELS79_05215 [Bifidobacterium longum subsp. longum]|nr:hypothetical protein [Bifidobacterium longum subsp. longum]MED7650058.1 hypothetical protein [Bifidobacterium longum]RDX07109.1 hypothetical protein CE171_02345 [Bifidobacterium longum]RDX10240.1 hypothetical protein CE165_01925 [Bifidobacterium longum]RGW08205.1 hypothetical protein DWV93_03680 [Bifidobacterium longum]
MSISRFQRIGKARAYFFLAFLTRLGAGAAFLGSKNGHLCKAQACSAGILATAKPMTRPITMAQVSRSCPATSKPMNTMATMKLTICEAFDCLAVTRPAFMGTSPRNRPQGAHMTPSTTLITVDTVVTSIMFLC